MSIDAELHEPANSERRPRASQASQPAIDDLLTSLRTALPAIQARAPRYDAEATYPAEDVAALREIGALRAFAEPDVAPLDLMEALRLVGRGNLSVGRIFEGHVNAAALIRWYGDARQRRGLDNALARGKVFGVWNTEAPPGVRIVDGKRGKATLVGAKTFATGAGFIDWAIVTGALPDGGAAMVIADAGMAERADPAAWRVRGMRATVSGPYDLTGLPADASTRLGEAGDFAREPRLSAGAWRFAAVQLGGVERIIGLLRDHLATTATGGEPVHRARFGEALAATRSAYLWVREAAVRFAAAEADDEDIVPFVLMTRGVVERAGLQAMEASARTVGTKAFFEDLPLDQACRDLALYLRQPAPDQAADNAAAAFVTRDRWRGDALW